MQQKPPFEDPDPREQNYKDIRMTLGPIQNTPWVEDVIAISSAIAFYGVGCILYLIGTGIGCGV